MPFVKTVVFNPPNTVRFAVNNETELILRTMQIITTVYTLINVNTFAQRLSLTMTMTNMLLNFNSDLLEYLL